MKTNTSSRRIVSDDNVEVHYWINYTNGMDKKFKFLHPASSMNHTALEPLESMMNKENMPTIILDPRGTGYSQTPISKEYFKLESYTKDIEKILTAEGIEKPDFIGHSMGFMPTVNYVANTNNGDKIFGIGGSYHFPDTTANKALFHLFNRALRYNEIAGSAVTGIWHNMNNRLRPYNDQSISNKNSYLMFVDVPIKEAINHCVSGIEINKWNISEQLKKIENPVILIYGYKDIAVVPEKAGLKIMDMVKNPDSDMYELNGGHDLPLKRPEAVMEIIKKYN